MNEQARVAMLKNREEARTAKPRRVVLNPTPFHVYYRHSRGKGFKAFKTRDAQVKFIINAPMSFAITSYN